MGRQCTACGEVKPRSGFSPHKSGFRGLQPKCKPCRVISNAACRGSRRAEYLKHRDTICARASRWVKDNPVRVLADRAKRRAAKRCRTPKWLTQADLAEIEGMYHFASVMCQITGRQYHVDHIIPLQGKRVSGLHVPENLQVIPARDNLSKGNHYGV